MVEVVLRRRSMILTKEARKTLHLAQQNGTPVGEIGYVVGLNGVLIHRVAAPAADAEVLRCL